MPRAGHTRRDELFALYGTLVQRRRAEDLGNAHPKDAPTLEVSVGRGGGRAQTCSRVEGRLVDTLEQGPQTRMPRARVVLDYRRVARATHLRMHLKEFCRQRPRSLPYALPKACYGPEMT